MSTTTDYASFGDDVLFVGHSLVGFLPDMLADIVSDGGGTGTFSAQIQNGAPLRWNWQESQRATVDALVVLPEGETDVLILTEAIPLDPNLKFNKTELYAADFYNLAIDSNPDTKVYMYETWHSIWSGTDRADDIPYKSGAGDLIPWRERLELDLEKWEGVVDSVNSQRGAGEPEMLLIPAGQALGRLSDAIDAGQVPGLTSIEELFSDDIHLNELGQYFVAMVQYATIYGEDPSGIDAQLQGRFGTDFDAPSEALAAAFQEIAWEAVTEYTGSAGSGGGTDPVPTPDPNTAPDAIFDKVTIDQDQTVQIAVLDNDVDVDGDALTVTAVGTPGHGTAEIQGGEIRYTPAAGFAGTDSFSYTVSDGQGGTDTAWITVTVDPVNDAPVAGDDAPITDEDTPVTIDVLGNDSDVDGDPLVVSSVTDPANGSVTENPDGTLTYTPDANFTGTDTFTYTVSDGQGGTDTATVSVTVDPVNDAPVAGDDAPITDEDTPVTIDVLGNDSDVDGDPLVVSSVTDPANGSVTENPDGTLTYTPDANFTGTDTFTYTVSDGQGGTDTATVTVTVDPVNDAPVAGDDTPITDEDTPVTIDVLGNDSDVDGDTLVVSSVTDPANGSVTENPDGTLTYTPDANFTGTDTFTYTVSDGQGGTDTATVTVTVDPVNDAPVAGDDTPITDEDTPVTIDVLGNDSDVDGDALVVSSVTDPANGSVTENPDGTLTYTPDANFTGTDTFTYTVSDGQGGTDTATVTVTVDPVNDGLVAVDDEATVDEDTPVTIDVLGNDSDVDGDTLVIGSVTDPANGSVTENPDGTLTYTPDANFTGTDTFTYTVSDGQGGTDTATVTVTVDPVNDAPVAGDDTPITDEDTPVTIDVLGNDSDVDGDTLVIGSVTDPANGSVTENPDGTLTYTPDANFTGTDTFTYTVSDGQGGTDTATVTVTVDPVNDAPVAGDDTPITDEDTPVTIDVLGNDSDVDGDTLVVSSVTDPANGSVTENPDGTLTYTPDANFTGTDTFTYTVSDGQGGTDTATVTVTVDPVNDAPVAGDDEAGINADATTTISVLDNDSDVDGDLLTIVSVTDPTDGTVTLNPDGTISYDPGNAFDGLGLGETDTVAFEYTVSDGQGGTDTAWVTVTVNAVEGEPEPETGNGTFYHNAGRWFDGTDEEILLTPSAAEAGVLVQAIGLWSTLGKELDLARDHSDSGYVTTTIGTAVSFNGSLVEASFWSTQQNLNWQYGNELAEDALTAALQFGSVATNIRAVEGTDVVDRFLGNGASDHFFGRDGADYLSGHNNDDILNGGLGDDQIFGGNGWDIAEFSGTASDYDIAIEGAGYRITGADGSDYLHGIEELRFGDGDTVLVERQSNLILADDVAEVDEDETVIIYVTDNDILPIGGFISSISTGETVGQVEIGQGSPYIRYTPDANFTGTDTFTYTVSDGQGGTDTATVTVTVDPVNDAPVAGDDTPITDEDTPVTIDVLGNDSDVDGDALVVSSVTDPANGSVTENPDGTLTYTPDANFTGTDTFTYTVSDGQGGTDTATVTVTVDPVNDAPVAGDDAPITDEDTPVTIDVLGNDSDVDGDPLVVSSVTDPANGSVTENPDGTLTYTPDANFTGTDTFTYTVSDGQGGTDTATVSVTVDPVNDAPVAGDDAPITDEDTPVTINVLGNDSDVDGDPLVIGSVTDPANGSVTENPDGTLTYTPDANFTGTDTFTYTVSDGQGGTDTATVTVTVDPVNDAPVAGDDTPITDEDTPVTIDVLGNDSDVDGDTLVVSSVTDPANGSVTENPDGTLTYTPDADFTGTDTFTYTVSDGQGGTDTATVSVTVDPVNDAPVAGDDTPITDEDTPVTIDVLGNDSDVDGDPLVVSSVTDPANGSVTENPDGTLTYTPDANFTGTDTFTYTVSDGQGGTDTATVTVTVTVDPVNDAPVAGDDTPITDEDTPVTIDVLGNDSDVDGNTLVVSSVTDPANGSVTENPDGTLTYTPDANFTGTDTFTYTVSDGQGGTDTATVTVTVDPVNDAPVAGDDTPITDEDTPVTIDVLGNDSDVDGDTLVVSSVTDPANGSVTENPDGTLTYTPDADFTGTDTFTYTVSDGQGGTDTATVTVTVDPVNDAPVAGDDTPITDEDTPVTIDVLGNDSDVDGDALVVSSVTDPANGSVTENPDGTLTYTPDADFTGTDTFTYTVSDGQGGTDTATVTVTVDPVNDGLVAIDDEATVDEDTPVTIDVLGNDSDVDGDTLVVSSVTDPANGSVTENPDGTLTYTPDADFTGTDTFTYTVSDGQGRTDTATVSVTVDPVNDAPVVVSQDTYTVPENSRVVGNIIAEDPDQGDIVSYSIDTNSADAALFDIDPVTGELTFAAAPDFEAPQDQGGHAFDNVYGLTILVSDGEAETPQEVSVNVIDVAEVPAEPASIMGTDGTDQLLGTAGDETFNSMGGRNDSMTGGGGADTFVFAEETSNGIREVDYITDFGADDRIDLGEAELGFVQIVPWGTYLWVSGDYDVILLTDVTSFDATTQLV